MFWCQGIEVAAYPNVRLFHGIMIYCNRPVGLTNNSVDTDSSSNWTVSNWNRTL